MITLLGEDPPQSFGVFVVKLAIARRGAFGVEQALTFEEPNF